MVTLVREDQVEEVVFEGRKPAVGTASKLLDVGQDDVRLLAVVDVRVLAAQNGNVGPSQHRCRRQNGTPSPKATSSVS